MRYESIFTASLKPKRNFPQIIIRGLAFSFLFTLIASMLSCQHRFVEQTNSKSSYQIGSLSVSGPKQASVVLQKTGEVKLTTDGGQTWQVVPSAEVGNDLEFAKMIDSNRGWAANRRGQVFKTDSGGASWREVPEFKDITGVAQIEFVNENDGWMREFLSIWRTRDGGVTWRETLSTVTPGVYGQPSGMFPIDPNTVVSSGDAGQVYLTKDGGETWRIDWPLGGSLDKLDFNDVWFVDQKHGWLTGYLVVVAGESLRPLLLETTDGGDSWKELYVDADIIPSSVCFVGNEGWLAGVRRIVNGKSIKLVGVLLRTEDGGKNWIPAQFGPEEPSFADVRFTDKTYGWLVGRDSLYRTEDSGKTWNPVLSLPPPR